MKTTISILCVLMLTLSATAQKADVAALQNVASQNPVGLKPGTSLFSLIDLSKIRWSNSYSVSYFSGGSASGSMGLLHTSMFYPISSKLNLTVDLGLAHDISGNLTASGRSATIVPGFSLDYRPSRNFSLSLNYRTYNGLIGPYGYRGAGYLINPFGPE